MLLTDTLLFLHENYLMFCLNNLSSFYLIYKLLFKSANFNKSLLKFNFHKLIKIKKFKSLLFRYIKYRQNLNNYKILFMKLCIFPSSLKSLNSSYPTLINPKYFRYSS